MCFPEHMTAQLLGIPTCFPLMWRNRNIEGTLWYKRPIKEHHLVHPVSRSQSIETVSQDISFVKKIFIQMNLWNSSKLAIQNQKKKKN